MTEGEQWARDELERLEAARFSPRALAAFLLAAQRRTGATRRARPEVARRGAAWMLVGGAGYLALGEGRALAWWAATWLMLDWHLGMLEGEDGTPRNLGPADAATLARAWMVPLAANGASPALCAAALLSDGLDGALARATVPTRFGRDLEGLVDFCFTVAALRGNRHALPGAALGLEATRQGAGLAYALACYFGAAQAPDPRVTRAARLTTPVRAAALAAAGAGRRRPAGVLLAGGSAWSIAALVRSARGSAVTP